MVGRVRSVCEKIMGGGFAIFLANPAALAVGGFGGIMDCIRRLCATVDILGDRGVGWL